MSSEQTSAEWQEIPNPNESEVILPHFVTLKDFLAEKMELPPILVGGFIRRRSVVMMASGSKSFKTWKALHLGLCVAHGVPWFAHSVTKGRVLFLNFELTPAELHSRLRVIAREMGVSDDSIDFEICNLRGQARDARALIPAVIKQCQGKQYDLIIPDPIYSMMGDRSENAADEMNDFLLNFSRLSEATGAAVLYTHHFAKGLASSKEQIDRASGSGVFARHADGIITLTRHKEDGAFVVEAELRSFPRPEAFVVRWQYPMMRLAEDLDPNQLKNKAGRPPKYDVSLIVECLDENGLKAGEWKARAIGAWSMSESIYYKLRALAIAARLVEQRGDRFFKVQEDTTRGHKIAA
jgi:hypothetical protein